MPFDFEETHTQAADMACLRLSKSAAVCVDKSHDTIKNLFTPWGDAEGDPPKHLLLHAMSKDASVASTETCYNFTWTTPGTGDKYTDWMEYMFGKRTWGTVRQNSSFPDEAQDTSFIPFLSAVSVCAQDKPTAQYALSGMIMDAAAILPTLSSSANISELGYYLDNESEMSGEMGGGETWETNNAPPGA